MSKILERVFVSGTKITATDKGYTVNAHTLKGRIEVDRFSSMCSDPYTNLQRGIIVANEIEQERV